MPAGDQYFSNVALLMHMDGANGSTTFTDVKGNTFTRAGSPVISTAQSKFGGASFCTANGNSNYLEADSTTLGQFGTEPFTVEGWVRPDTIAEAYGLTIAGNYVGTPAGWTARYGRNGNTRFVFGNDAALVDVPFVVTAGVWFHVAICRDTNGVRIYKDGVLAGSTASHGSSAVWDSTNKIRIGSDRDGVSGMLGYIDDLRITKGVARYTADFTPPAAAFPDIGYTDPYFSNVALLMHMDGADGSTTFTDVKGHTVTPAGNAQISTAQPKFGQSLSLGGAGNYLYTFSDDYNVFASDFTIECFVNANNVANAGIFQLSNTVGGFETANRGYVVAFNAGGGGGVWTVSNVDNFFSYNFSAGVWYHVAMVYNNSTVKLYIDGVKVAESTTLSAPAPAKYLIIGGYYSSGYCLDGKIDEFRISRVARYTADFTPPTAAFPDSAPAVGEYCVFGSHFDGANNSTTLIDDVKGKTLTALGAAKLSSAWSAFGATSLQVSVAGNGTDGFSIASSPDLAFGTGDFEVRGFFKLDAYSAQWGSFIYDGRVVSDADAAPFLCVTTGGKLQLGISSSVLITGTTTVSLSTSHFFVFKRVGSTLTLALDGVVEGTATNSADLVCNGAVKFGQSRNSASTTGFIGYFDDLQIYKGATVGSVAVPTTAFTTPAVLDAAAAAVATVTASLQTSAAPAAFSAVATAAASATAALSVGARLAASASSVATASAYFPGPSAQLAAAPAASATLSAAVTTSIRLAAAPSAACGVSATLASPSMYATAVAAVTASATLTSSPVAAAPSAVVTAAAALTTGVRCAAACTARSAATAALTTSIRPAAAAAATTTTSAGLTTAIRPAAAAAAATTASASLTAGIRAATTAQCSASAAASLTTSIRPAAAAAAVATVTATLSARAGLAASPTARTTVSASLTTAQRFAADVRAPMTATAALSTKAYAPDPARLVIVLAVPRTVYAD